MKIFARLIPITILLTLIIVNTSFSQGWIKVGKPSAGNVYCLALKESTLFAGTQSGIHTSTDNGLTWVFSGLVNITVNTMTVSGNYVFAGTNDGVYFSTNNGGRWDIVNKGNNGMSYTIVNALAVGSANIFAGTNGGGVYASSNNATSWTSVNTGLSDHIVQSLAVMGSTLFAGTSSGGVFQTANGGTVWTVAGISGLSINTIAVIGTNLFAGTNDGVYLFNTILATWTLVNNGLTSLTIPSLVVSQTNLFAGINGGGVYLSKNNGSNWSAVNTGLTEFNTKCIAIMGSYLFLANGSGNIWRRPLSEMLTNLSVKTTIPKQWLVISAGVRNISLANTFQGNVGTLSFTAQSSNTLVASASVTGSSLSVTPLSIGDCIITVTAIDAANNDFLATSFDINVGLTDVTSDPIPNEFSLYQNFPNPFNPSTKIKYELPQNAFIQLKIFDMLGREVKTILSGEQTAGFYEIEFDAKEIPSGIYFYRIEAGEFTQTKKMILMK
ncbi:MAG: T9SS type A sorting domain-containing protein [Ignavibacteriales bacterium]|nr:T9SS type A sorting domain-containing protein [Ignavibacteriales bacterium]